MGCLICLANPARLTNDGESLPEKWITYMDPINEALNMRADRDLLQRVSECTIEYNYYIQATTELGRLAYDEATQNYYTALTIMLNAMTDTLTEYYTAHSAESKYPKTYMAYEMLFMFGEWLPMFSEIDLMLRECGITVLNQYGESPDHAIRRNLTWYSDTDDDEG